jgi:hypothetical protein
MLIRFDRAKSNHIIYLAVSKNFEAKKIHYTQTVQKFFLRKKLEIAQF